MNHMRVTMLGVVLLCTGANVMSSLGEGMTIGRYDFGYTTMGDPRLKPVQVFDDGQGKTFFQFRPGEAIPAMFAGDELQIPTLNGPYIVVNTRSRDYTLALGLARSRVVHASVLSGAQPPAQSRPVLLASNGSLPAGSLPDSSKSQPAKWNAADPTQSSYATPVKGDVIEWRDQGATIEQPVLFVKGSSSLSKDVKKALGTLAGRIGPDSKVTIVGREDSSQKEGLAEDRARALRDALVASGIPQSNIIAKVGVEVKTVGQKLGSRLVESTIRWTPMSVPRTLPNSTAQTHAASSRSLGAVTFETIQSLLTSGHITQSKADQMRKELAAGGRGQQSLTQFDMHRSDKTIGEAMSRWAAASGYELIWDAQKVELLDEATIQAPNFLEAVRRTIAGLQQAGYPIKAKAYQDKVVHVSVKE